MWNIDCNKDNESNNDDDNDTNGNDAADDDNDHNNYIFFQCIYQNSMPPYISDLLHPYCPSRTLRSLDASLLTVPRFSLETFGKKSFSVFGPTVWNSLPLSLRKSQCFTTFKVKLKTHLFRTHLCWSVQDEMKLPGSLIVGVLFMYNIGSKKSKC